MGVTYKCLIVDDEKPAHQVLLSHIKQCEDLECIGNAYSGKEALTFLQNNKNYVILLYNMTSKTKLTVKDLKELKKILVGNKSDLDRYVTKEEAEKFMNTNNFSLFFETSAKTGENVEKVIKNTFYRLLWKQ